MRQEVGGGWYAWRALPFLLPNLAVADEIQSSLSIKAEKQWSAFLISFYLVCSEMVQYVSYL